MPFTQNDDKFIAGQLDVSRNVPRLEGIAFVDGGTVADGQTR